MLAFGGSGTPEPRVGRSTPAGPASPSACRCCWSVAQAPPIGQWKRRGAGLACVACRYLSSFNVVAKGFLKLWCLLIPPMWCVLFSFRSLRFPSSLYCTTFCAPPSDDHPGRQLPVGGWATPPPSHRRTVLPALLLWDRAEAVRMTEKHSGRHGAILPAPNPSSRGGAWSLQPIWSSRRSPATPSVRWPAFDLCNRGKRTSHRCFFWSCFWGVFFFNGLRVNSPCP